MKQRLLRLDRIAGQMNAWLLVIAIGLGMLDLAVLVANCIPALTIPPPATGSRGPSDSGRDSREYWPVSGSTGPRRGAHTHSATCSRPPDGEILESVDRFRKRRFWRADHRRARDAARGSENEQRLPVGFIDSGTSERFRQANKRLGPRH